ncbi:MAG: AraC family transcriptional regulator, partial [Coprobacillus sp.]
MEWTKKLELIIDYVENHLQRYEEDICHDDIERIAGCSFLFFQKVFSYMNGISFSEYIRFRKMTLAGYDLKSTQMKVIEVSYKYGYDSPTSFTKAFQQFHGVSPKEARNKDVELKVYAKMLVTSKQAYAWKLEQRNDLHLIGKRISIA